MISLRTKLNESEAIFFSRVILYNFSHFCSFMVVWGFRVGFIGLVFSVDGVLGLRLSI